MMFPMFQDILKDLDDLWSTVAWNEWTFASTCNNDATWCHMFICHKHGNRLNQWHKRNATQALDGSPIEWWLRWPAGWGAARKPGLRRRSTPGTSVQKIRPQKSDGLTMSYEFPEIHPDISGVWGISQFWIGAPEQRNEGPQDGEQHTSQISEDSNHSHQPEAASQQNHHQRLNDQAISPSTNRKIHIYEQSSNPSKISRHHKKHQGQQIQTIQKKTKAWESWRPSWFEETWHRFCGFIGWTRCRSCVDE